MNDNLYGLYGSMDYLRFILLGFLVCGSFSYGQSGNTKGEEYEYSICRFYLDHEALIRKRMKWEKIKQVYETMGKGEMKLVSDTMEEEEMKLL